jgi:hypothetical protein
MKSPLWNYAPNYVTSVLVVPSVLLQNAAIFLFFPEDER